MADQTGSVASMTGFARQEGGDDALTWMWEIRSGNGRSLDVRCRLPAGYEALDPAARATVQEHLSRGNLQVSLTVNRAAAPVQLLVNRALLDQLIALIRELEGEIESAPPSLDALLGFRGVVEAVEPADTKEQAEAREAAMEQDLVLALEALTAMRRAEGGRLKTVVAAHLEEIGGLLEAAAGTAAAQPEALRERLRAQVEELLKASPALPEERLAQEAAVLVAKADVREELDRLRAHSAAARELLDQGGPIGRRLDFLCQELNREANTLCSKSWDVALTRIGLDLKAAIERLREQVQNIE